jgi:hypothetical protein
MGKDDDPVDLRVFLCGHLLRRCWSNCEGSGEKCGNSQINRSHENLLSAFDGDELDLPGFVSPRRH